MESLLKASDGGSETGDYGAAGQLELSLSASTPDLSEAASGASEDSTSRSYFRGKSPGNDGSSPTRKNVMAQASLRESPSGHRERVRDRLLDRGPDGLADYELLEMLLFLVQPKGDTKPLAKRLINSFGSYTKVLSATQDQLLAVVGVGRQTIIAVKLIQDSAVRLARAEVLDQPILSNWEQLMAYLNAVMARERVEQFRILFLDTKNRLIADELQGRGTINHTAVYIREVAKRTLELHAASIILTHNHPSGDPTPSMADLDMTTEVQRVLNLFGVTVHDHVIIGNGKWVSLRKEGFL